MWNSTLGSFLALVLFVAVLTVTCHGENVHTARRLQQRQRERVDITEENVNRLASFVREAEEDAVFVFASDMQLPSLINVTTNRVTFGGAEDDPPILICADGEGGFQVNADGMVFENLIFQNCSQTVIAVFDDVNECSPVDANCTTEEAIEMGITIRSVDFLGNNGSIAGSTTGALSAGNKIQMNVSSCRFARNRGTSGGAISFIGRMLFVADSSFTENVAENTGGAIFAIQPEGPAGSDAQTEARFRIRNCSFANNRVLKGGTDRGGLTSNRLQRLEVNLYISFPLPSPSGGAIYVADFSEVSIDQCTFSGNNAVPAGGAVYLGDNTGINITDCSFQDNYVRPPQAPRNSADLQQGGAIFAAFSNIETELVILSSTFRNNSATYGGGMHLVGPIESRFRLDQCMFVSNLATRGGGAAVFRNVGLPGIARTRFMNNTAFVGGAVFLTNGGGLEMMRADFDSEASEFLGNVAFDGGALFGLGGGSLTLLKTFFTGNQAFRNGGAVCFVDSQAGSMVVIEEARMSNNSAEAGGAIFLENVSEFLMEPQEADPNAALLGIDINPRNEFIGNVAVAGGAICYRASNLVNNRFVFVGASFVSNRAVSNLSLIYPEPLMFPDVGGEGRKLLQMDVDRNEQSRDVLLNPKSIQSCSSGGGGAICFILHGITDRAPVSVEVSLSNFTQNEAVVGGAMLISTEDNIQWLSECPSSTDETSSLLTSDPCRSLGLRSLIFERNIAQAAGGAIFASNLTHVYYSRVLDSAADFNFQTLDLVANSDAFRENNIAPFGYGPNVAGTAVRLSIRDPIPDAGDGLLIANQSSGQASPLPRIAIEVLDMLDQVITAGIVDSAFPIRAESQMPEQGPSIAAGQTVATPREGVAVFDALTLSAPPAEYDVVFSAAGDRVESARGRVTIRRCSLGERYDRNRFICEACAFETFTLYTDVSSCAPCPEDARCSGNASLVPVAGFWHSSPFSVIIHECFRTEACNYRNRTRMLESQRERNLVEFLDRFNQSEVPVFTNAEYRQCAQGYEGPLCGSCTVGYGHADDKTCVKCHRTSVTALLVFIMVIWQLFFLGITVRSALASIRDMNALMIIAQKHTPRNPVPPRRDHGWQSDARLVLLSSSNAATQGTDEGSSIVTQTEPEIQVDSTPTALDAVSTKSTGSLSRLSKEQLSAECIVASQHVSETIKIFTNFFQITATAANMNLRWPSSIKNMLVAMNFVAGFSDGTTFALTTCLVDADSDKRAIHGVILRIFLPAILMGLVLCVFLVQWFVLRRSANMTHVETQRFLRSRSITCFLVVGFFAYQSLCEILMGTISCIRLDAKDLAEARTYDDLEDGINYSQFSIAKGRYWTEDTNVECFTGMHASLVGFVGLPGIVLFLIGVPSCLFIFLLLKRQSNELMDLDVLNTYGFIYQSYEDKFVYWEVCILLRKTLISAIAVYAYPLGASLQGTMAMAALMFAMVSHLIATPYKYLPLNVLEGASLVVSFITFFVGMVLNDENSTYGTELVLTVLLILTNFLLVMVFLITILLHGDKYVMARLAFLDVIDIPSSPVARAALLASLLSANATSTMTTAVRRKFTSRTAPRSQMSDDPSFDSAQLATLPATRVPQRAARQFRAAHRRRFMESISEQSRRTESTPRHSQSMTSEESSSFAARRQRPRSFDARHSITAISEQSQSMASTSEASLTFTVRPEPTQNLNPQSIPLEVQPEQSRRTAVRPEESRHMGGTSGQSLSFVAWRSQQSHSFAWRSEHSLSLAGRSQQSSTRRDLHLNDEYYT